RALELPEVGPDDPARFAGAVSDAAGPAPLGDPRLPEGRMILEFWREWLNPESSNHRDVFGPGSGVGLLGLSRLLRSCLYIKRFGFVNWLKTTFRIDGENFRVIGILLLVAIAVALMYLRGGG